MEKELSKIRHSAAHILAQAVLRLYPSTKIAIGPAIEDGFYYDFDKKDGFSNEDLKKIEKEMKKIVSENLKIEEYKIPKKELDEYLKNQPFKKELYNDFKKEKKGITFYKQGEHLELCAGNHVTSTGQVKHFKLLRIAGAYWKGDSKNKMLTRIYGTAFPSDIELKEYLTMQEEAAKRDHKKVGKDLDLFIFSELIGPGLPIYTPRGTIMRNELVNYSKEINKKLNFVEVHTPNMNKAELFKISGHYDKFKDDNFRAVSNYSKEEYFLKPMNCPQHTQVFAAKKRSYKDLPIRIADFANLYRDEKPGELSGLSRLRCFSQDDGHAFCREDQVEEEFNKVLSVVKEALSTFGLEYWFRLSLWDPDHKEKYLGDEKTWNFSQNQLRTLLKKAGVKFEEAIGEAAFYGPKVDIIVRDALKREWQISTIQIDRFMPMRFNLKYTDKDNTEKTPVMIHRAIAGSPERFMSILIEHYAGNFPAWLNPSQVIIVNVNDSNLKFAQEILDKMTSQGIRVELDSRSESVGKKVRDSILMKPNYIITIGDKESKNKKLAIRHRSGKLDFDVSPEKFIESLLQEIKLRK